MVYNTLLVKYKNSWQLRTYDFPVKCEDEKNSKFEKVENEIDKAFSVLDSEYHFEGRSAYVSINRSKNKIFYYARFFYRSLFLYKYNDYINRLYY